MGEEIFAKLFNLGCGRQVLVTTFEDEEEKPKVQFRTMISGLDTKVSYGFPSWEKATEFFNKIGDTEAYDYYQSCKKMINGEE